MLTKNFNQNKMEFSFSTFLFIILATFCEQIIINRANGVNKIKIFTKKKGAIYDFINGNRCHINKKN